MKSIFAACRGVPACSCLGVQTPLCRDVQGRPPWAGFLITWWRHLRKCQDPANLVGSCNIVRDLGKGNTLQGIYLWGREQISHLSKNGKNRHKGTLVFTGSPGSQAHSWTGESTRRLASMAGPWSLTICPTVAGQTLMAGGWRTAPGPTELSDNTFWCPRFSLFLCPWVYNLPVLLEGKGQERNN